MEKSRIPIKFSGLNQKFDDKQSVPGSFAELTNVLFDKIGRIDRRYSYANLAVNDILNPNLMTDNSRILARITKYENTLMALVKNYSWANYLLVNPDITFEADNLAVDIDIKAVESKSVYNPNLKQEANYSEQYQNIEVNERFAIQGLLAVEAKRGIHTFKIFRNDMEIFNFTSPANGNTSEQYNAYNKLVTFETKNGSNRTCYFLYLIFNAAGDSGKGTTEAYLIGVKGSNTPSNDISYVITNYGNVSSLTTSYDGTSIVSLAERSFDLEVCGGTNSRKYVSLVHNDGPNTPKLKTFYVDIAAPGTLTLSDSKDIANPSSYVYDMSVPTIKRIKKSPIDSSCKIAFAGSFFGWSFSNEKSFRTIYTAIYDIDLTSGAITTDVAFDHHYTYSSSLVTFAPPIDAIPSGTAEALFATRSIINLAFASDTDTGTSNSLYSPPRLLVSTVLAYYRGSPTAYLECSMNNKSANISYFDFNISNGSISLISTLYNRHLASKVVTGMYSDYFITAVTDSLQATYQLEGFNRNGNKSKIISQFLYQNAGTVSNFNLDQSIKDMTNVYKSNGFYIAPGTFLKNINFGWTSNLFLSSSYLNLFTGYKLDINLYFGAAYRNNFSSKPQNSIAVDPTGVFPYLTYYSQNTLQGYTDACSSRIVKFNLNSKTQFSNQNLYKNKYFTGGYLSSFNGKQFSHNGVHQYPEFVTYQGKSPTKDPFGQLRVVNGDGTFAGSYFSKVGSKWFFSGVAAGIDPAFDEIKLNYSTTQELNVGDKVRLAASGIVPTLPSGINPDPSGAVLDFAYPAIVSDEYLIESVSVPVGGIVIITLKDSTGTHVDITTAGTWSNYFLVKSPYRVFTDKIVNFVAVFTYHDANGNLIRSAPSAPLEISSRINYASSQPTFYTTYKLVLEVFNYNYADKQFDGNNPVSVELYRTIGNATTAVYYLCGTTLCNNTQTLLSISTEYLTDDDLVKGQQLYTTGGELESIPVPNPSSLTVKDNRLYAVNGENKSEIWYSKTLLEGEGVEFNDALTKRVNTSDGKILAIQSMDEKIIIFKENSILYFVGDGANATGQGEQFSEVQRISGNTGLDPNNANCFLLIDEGIVFKSTKGIYLLSRGLGAPVYIGAGIEDEVRGAILFGNIVENKKRNEIKLAINNKVWVFNREQKLWYSEESGRTFLDFYSDLTGIYAVASPVGFTRISDGKIFFANQFLKQYDPTDFNLPVQANKYDDFGAGISSGIYTIPVDAKYYYEEKLQTNWIELAGIQNFARIPRVFLLGQLNTTWGNTFNIKITFEYDFGSGGTETMEYSNADFIQVGNNWQLECHLGNQKSQSIRITIESLNSDSNINNLQLSSILFEAGIRSKLPLSSKKIK